MPQAPWCPQTAIHMFSTCWHDVQTAVPDFEAKAKTQKDHIISTPILIGLLVRARRIQSPATFAAEIDAELPDIVNGRELEKALNQNRDRLSHLLRYVTCLLW